MKRNVVASSCMALWLCGCSTLTGDFHQRLQIDALDARNRPLEGMQCQIGTGSSAKTFVTPATDVRVRRALEPLAIECRRDSLIATATVKSRRERMEEALLPFGSVGVFVDHLSGSLYAYPTTLHLRVGQHLVLEHGGEAQVVTAEPIPGAANPVAASAQRTELAVVQPAVGGIAASTQSTPTAPQKAPTAAPKAERAVTKPVKTASAAATATKLRAAAAATATPTRQAPLNW